jgi:hypothetical protein
MGENRRQSEWGNSPEGIAVQAALTKKLLIAEAEKTLTPAPIKNEMSAEDFLKTE